MREAACGIALLLVAAGLFRAEGAFFAAALPFAAYAAYGLLRPLPALSLTATRHLAMRFSPAGAPVQITLTVTNTGRRIEALRLVDPLPPGVRPLEGEPVWCGSLDPGAQAVIRYTLTPPRGIYAFPVLEAEAEDPFVGVQVRASLPCPSSLAVYPRTLAAPAGTFGAGSARPFSGRSRTKRRGAGTDFAGTRDYAPGDPLRCLNWRAEALWGRPIVNVFEEERAIDAGIILDCRAESYDRQELFESAVLAALSMAEDLLDRGNRVAFLSYGALISWTPPGAGQEQRTRLRLAAARAVLGAHAAFDRFDNLPVKIFPPRSLVLLVSPLLRDDVPPLRSLRALGYEVAVLAPRSLEPTVPGRARSLAERLLFLEREVLLSRLLRARIAILDWNAAEPLTTPRIHDGSRA